MDDKIELTISAEGFNKKLNALSPMKKMLVIFFMLVILGVLFYMTTIKTVETIDFKQNGTLVCTETYINGQLNGSSCQAYYTIGEWDKLPPIKGLENLTLIQNQSLARLYSH